MRADSKLYDVDFSSSEETAALGNMQIKAKYRDPDMKVTWKPAGSFVGLFVFRQNNYQQRFIQHWYLKVVAESEFYVTDKFPFL